MNSHAQHGSQESEVRFLEELRPSYEDKGFTFTIAPDRRDLPPFLDSYVPDAVASKPGLSIAIEVKRQRDPSEHRVQHIRQLFDGQPGWRFNVVFAGGDPLETFTLPPVRPATIRIRMNEVTALNAQGYRRAAFVIAWSLLEAALHSLGGETISKPHTASAVLQILAIEGHIGPDLERRLRSLIALRNRIVHGDVDAEPSAADVDLILSAISHTLEAA